MGGSAFGIGLGWNDVTLNVSATLVDASIKSGGAIGLLAQSTQSNGLLNGKISSAAVSGAVGTNTAIGGAVSVNGITNTIDANIDDTSSVNSTAAGTISVAAQDGATINAFVGGAAISLDGGGIGAALGGNYIEDTVTAGIDGKATSAGGDVDTSATETAGIEAITVGLAAGDQAGVGGSVSVSVIGDKVTAELGASSDVQADQGAVNVTATNSATVGSIAGQVAAGDEAGVGAAATVLSVTDTTAATIGANAIVHGQTGVLVEATNSESLTDFALEGSASGTAAVGGSVTATVIDDTTTATIAGADSAGHSVSTGTGLGTTGDVTVEAFDELTLVGTAGAISVGGSVGVGVGVDAGVVTLDTEATIGEGADVTADGNVIVDAAESEDIVSVSVSGTGGGDVAVGANAGVTDLTLTTAAAIDSGATVTANDNVVVTAEDDTTTTQVAGAIEAAGYVAVGVAADVGVITKTTTSTIAGSVGTPGTPGSVVGADVTAKALGSSIIANTGGFASGDAVAPASATVSFDTAAVGAGGLITGSTSGLQTGDEVVYQGSDGALGGLQNGATYFVIVVDGSHFELASTLANAQNGIAIAVSAGLSSSGSQNQIAPVVALPSVSSGHFNASNLSSDPEGAPTQAAQSGVVVAAVSTNSFEGVGGAAGAALVAVEVAGTVGVNTIDTKASVGAGATVGGGAGSVAVVAGRTYHSASLGLGGAAGAVGGHPGRRRPHPEWHHFGRDRRRGVHGRRQRHRRAERDGERHGARGPGAARDRLCRRGYRDRRLGRGGRCRYHDSGGNRRWPGAG